MAYITPTPRLQTFLSWLADADPEDHCYPPGLGGVWKVRWIRQGLDEEVLVVHHSGLGLAIQVPDAHAKKGCRCRMCQWFMDQRLADLRSPQCPPQKVAHLRRMMLQAAAGELPAVTF